MKNFILLIYCLVAFSISVFSQPASPTNDNCADAIPIPGIFGTSYPVTVNDSNINANISCSGVLDWQAVWYAVELPYASNNFMASYCGTASSIESAGIIYYTNCPGECDAYNYMSSIDWNCDNGSTNPSIYFNDIPGPTVIYFPAYITPMMNFMLTFNVTQAAPPDIYGCTDPLALNYNPDANVEDSSCTYLTGCTDPEALNYNPDAVIDDGSCVYSPPPPNDNCTNAIAIPGEYGTTYPVTIVASNIDVNVTCPGYLDWYAAWYAVELPYTWNNLTIHLNGISDSITALGIIYYSDCTEDCSAFSHFDFFGNDNEGTFLTKAEIPGPGVIYFPANVYPQMTFQITFDVIQAGPPAIYGCTDSYAANYNPNATADDGSCIYTPCVYSIKLFDSSGNGWNGGSMDIYINNNYYISATLSNGYGPEVISFPVQNGNQVDIFYNPGLNFEGNYYEIYDGDGNFINSNNYQSTSFIAHCTTIFGCMDPLASNYDSTANIDNGSCLFNTCNVDASYNWMDQGYGSYEFHTNINYSSADYFIQWTFGDNNSYIGSDSVTHTYASAGYYLVTAYVQSNNNPDCLDSVSNWINIYYTSAGCNLNAEFTSYYQGNLIYEFCSSQYPGNIEAIWDFGDGNTATDTPCTYHGYLESGVYTVSLTLYDINNTFCYDTYSTTVYVDTGFCNINADFQSTDQGGGFVVFMTDDLFTPQYYNVSWSFGDGDTSSGGDYVGHLYSESGTYLVSDYVQDIYNPSCWDTAQQWINVVVPICNVNAAFTWTNMGNGLYEFNTYNSYIPPEYTVNWDLGDGFIDSGIDLIDHSYSTSGLYQVTATVYDNYYPDCWNSVQETVEVVVPQCSIDPGFTATEIGNGQFDFHTNTEYPGTDYQVIWTFGDSTQELGYQVYHTYTVSGTYTVCVNISDLNNPDCFASQCNAYNVNIIPPCNANADFIYNTDNIFTVTTTAFADPSQYNITWNWGDGSNGNGSTLTHSYASAGSYTITCIVQNIQYPGCMDTVSYNVNMPGPHPDWNYTVTGVSHIIMIPSNCNITIEGVPVVAGDYIGVFYDNGVTLTCGGYVMYTGQTTVVTAWGDNPQTTVKDGFTIGEQFHWKLWQTSSNNVYNATAVYLPVGIGGITNQQYFAANGTSGISSLSYVLYQSQTITLLQGWSFISTYIIPNNPGCFDIFNPVLSDVIIVKNGAGAVFWPQYNLNNIGNFVLGEGYQLKMSVLHTINVVGLACVPQTSPFNIPVGWSILGYLRQVPGLIASMLAPVTSNIIIVKNGNGNVFWPFYGLNAIGYMNPGEGYQIKMNSGQTLIYPANGPASMAKSDPVIYCQNYIGVLNTGNNMTVGIPVSAWTNMPLPGDEVGIFNMNGDLLGSSVYNGNNMAVTVWGDDVYTDETEGITNGESFNFRLWNHNSGEEQQLTVESWLQGDQQFGSNAISVVGKFTSVDLTTDNVILYQNIPNPFNQNTLIKFYLPHSCNVKLEIFNVLGELTKVMYNYRLDSGTYSITFSGDDYISGSYFYRLTTDEFTGTKTMNIIK
ncbi:MAG: PKD domain-containing protein [Bacteroidia bacterium]|nr:PKD domain-containing protein [Bacteroidia bacterium]